MQNSEKLNLHLLPFDRSSLAEQGEERLSQGEDTDPLRYHPSLAFPPWASWRGSRVEHPAFHQGMEWGRQPWFWQCVDGERFLRHWSRRLDPRQAVCSLFWRAGGAEKSSGVREFANSQIGPARSGAAGRDVRRTGLAEFLGGR